MNTRRVLVIAAHADDEALGCGGTLALHASRGDEVRALFMTDGVGARAAAEDAAARQRREAASAALACVGVRDATFLALPDNQMDGLSLLEIVRQVEPVIAAFRPDVVYTHHFADLNVDHRLAHQATMTALRPQPGALAPTILCFEVPSSTEWQTPSAQTAFIPNWFQDISGTFDRKIAALKFYAEEMRAWPHSRSIEAVTHLARWRGASVGVEAAEAFMLARHIAR
jgi:LmbE family N-acetylglucosaminyl deacetylase